MAVDAKIAKLIKSVREKKRAFTWTDPESGEEYTIQFAKLTFNDNIKIDEETGRNIFAEFAEAASDPQHFNIFKTFSYAMQRKIAFYSLRKIYPKITEEEVGDIITAMPQDVLWQALLWAIPGTGAENPPTARSRTGTTTQSSG